MSLVRQAVSWVTGAVETGTAALPVATDTLSSFTVGHHWPGLQARMGICLPMRLFYDSMPRAVFRKAPRFRKSLVSYRFVEPYSSVFTADAHTGAQDVAGFRCL